jgi:hypothetical protein
MHRRRARLALLLAASCAFAARARAGSTAELRVDAPAPAESSAATAWIEVRGQAAGRLLAAHDLVLVLDLSDSSLLPSGWDVDGDGPRGATDPALLARFAAKPDFPPGVLDRLRASDFDDSTLAAELVAARALLQRLDAGHAGDGGARHRAGIVVFSNTARVAAPLGASPAELDRALDEIRDTFYRELGGTNFGDAIGAAQLLLQPETAGQSSGPPSGRDQSILLLSDGEPTLPPFGDRARQHALYAASAAAAAGIRIFPFELARAEEVAKRAGLRAAMADRTVLAEMAERSGGRFERLDRPGDAIARLRRTDLVGLAELRIVNETSGAPARALRTFPDGSFDGFIALEPGRNRIAIEARTTDGATAAVERVVTRSGADANGERSLLDELRRRTRETEIWAEMERERRAPKRELEIRVEPPGEIP